jgi:hypothetical protein
VKSETERSRCLQLALLYKHKLACAFRSLRRCILSALAKSVLARPAFYFYSQSNFGAMQKSGSKNRINRTPTRKRRAIHKLLPVACVFTKETNNKITNNASRGTPVLCLPFAVSTRSCDIFNMNSN